MNRGRALVLTGGASRRMGRHKALLELPEGTFLQLILQRLKQAQVAATVIRSPALELATDPEVEVLVNPEPERGQLSSLQVGLRPHLDGLDWLMVCLVDHPRVALSTYQALVKSAQSGGAAIWAPSYQGRRGHPIVFARCCFDDLMRAPLDQGARWVVGRHRKNRREVVVDDPEILRDVDTPEEYAHLRG